MANKLKNVCDISVTFQSPHEEWNATKLQEYAIFI